jgi:DNA-binding PadR family transcriptional regulator
MHGYGIAKEISRMFEGTYIPSAGVIYPTLQWLEDEGYISKTPRQKEATTSYSITESGKKYLKQNEQGLSEIIRFVKERNGGAEFPILKSAARLQRTIASSLHEMSSGKKLKVAKILDDANEKVLRLLSE